MSTLATTSYESSTLSGFYAWTDTLKAIYYGPGSVKTALPKLLDQLGAKKALIVTGKSLHQKASLLILVIY
jgi:alcohol dehydrogenase class IV